MHEDRLRALRVLSRIKESALEKVQADMASCMAKEARLLQEIAEGEKEIARQRDEVLPHGIGEDALLLQQSFREWLPDALSEIQSLENQLSSAKQETGECRGRLAAANLELEATADLIRTLEAEDRADRQRKEQNEIDDISRGQFLLRRKIKKRKTIV
ncbi:hypothetical protein AA14337_3333 [Acetobacter malorum DSM 14337]|uniref:Flagellar FliJ protein n=2 Tax=Acetobacter malorum TaxID=178901 RepID=A0ABQ0Q113_9PROT|nr:hypothetical protein AD930_07710 [Acetobacter malorum]GBQ86484.1 hypothetical protein AA14337_3333 [Acetobacter malorum DSM 14337]